MRTLAVRKTWPSFATIYIISFEFNYVSLPTEAGLKATKNITIFTPSLLLGVFTVRNKTKNLYKKWCLLPFVYPCTKGFVN